VTPSQYERQVILFNLAVRAAPEQGTLLPMKNILDMIETVHAAGDAFWMIGAKAHADENDDETADRALAAGERPSLITIAAYRRGRNKSGGTFLFNFGDITGTDPAFLHIETRRVRVIKRAAEEGTGYGAHLTIGPEQFVLGLSRHRCALEIMPHLIQFVNRLLRIATRGDESFVFPDPDTSRLLRFRPKLSSSLQPSQTLIKDITEGKLSHIEFFTREIKTQTDELPQIVSERRTLRVRVQLDDPTAGGIRHFLNQAKDWGRKRDFDEMQLRFSRGDVDRSASARFSTLLADAADALYSRTETISGFSAALAQCPEELDIKIHRKLGAMVADDRLWR
jgi:hypothetical protein